MRIVTAALIVAGLLAAATDRRVDLTAADALPVPKAGLRPAVPISGPDSLKTFGLIPIPPPTAAQWNDIFLGQDVTGTTRSVGCGRDASCHDRR